MAAQQPPLMRKVSSVSGARAAASFERKVNEEWMEAIDAASNRLYYVRLELSPAGDSVRPHPEGITSWDAPNGFLGRLDLVAALSSAIHGASTDDEAAFLAKVRARFPPPSTPPSASAAERELAELRHRVVQLEEEKKALFARVEAAAVAQVTNMSTSGAPPPASGQAAERPSWKRGASSKFALGVDAPPPPPEWALAKAGSGLGPVDMFGPPEPEAAQLDQDQSSSIVRAETFSKTTYL